MTGELQGRPSPRRRAWAVRSLLRPAWQQEGHEPDYRFSLANERTFLGWLRTALAFMAGAVAVSQLPEFGVNGLRDVEACFPTATVDYLPALHGQEDYIGYCRANHPWFLQAGRVTTVGSYEPASVTDYHRSPVS